MSDLGGSLTPGTPSLATPGLQQAVRFLGAVLRIRVGGEASGGQLAVVEHEGERGYCAPLHRRDAEEETFLVLDGELRVEVDGQAQAAGAGAAAFLPRKVPHAFVVTSPQARFLTLHVPAGFERFVLAGGLLLTPVGTPTSDEPARCSRRPLATHLPPLSDQANSVELRPLHFTQHTRRNTAVTTAGQPVGVVVRPVPPR
ncbi:cupin domain-containing protein [Streptomyces spinoverrucosus]|uniref:cupin domain-containing protein n=1 Tax=Streptomyces spinoverrucosus TaxID=284043 RepID=UPI0018C3B5BD|nr:cupin domain-containing protein [Streptomyces spinoverrucosus]MBG0857694.1 cupin domain-containing protein [Streptomyces spinoverrucosus]